MFAAGRVDRDLAGISCRSLTSAVSVQVAAAYLEVQRYDPGATVHLSFPELWHVERQRASNVRRIRLFPSQLRHVERQQRFRLAVRFGRGGSDDDGRGGDGSGGGGGGGGGGSVALLHGRRRRRLRRWRLRCFYAENFGRGLRPAPQFRHVERHVQQFLIVVAGLGAYGYAAVGPVVLAVVVVELDQSQRLRRSARLVVTVGRHRGRGGRPPALPVLQHRVRRGVVQRRLVRYGRQDVRPREPITAPRRRLGTVRAQRVAGAYRLQAQAAAGRHAVRAPVRLAVAVAAHRLSARGPSPVQQEPEQPVPAGRLAGGLVLLVLVR